VLPSWDRAVAEDWLGKWAMNLMLINVSTPFGRWWCPIAKLISAIQRKYRMGA
jgi:hypothetical protein